MEVADGNAFALDALTVELWIRTAQNSEGVYWPGAGAVISKATPGPGSADWTLNLASEQPGKDQAQDDAGC